MSVPGIAFQLRDRTMIFGPDPLDPQMVFWRAVRGDRPSRSLASGRVDLAGGYNAELALLAVRRFICRNQADLLAGGIAWTEVAAVPRSQVCGRLGCAKSRPHGHRAWKAGDLFAVREVDPTDGVPMPVPYWGRVVEPDMTSDDRWLGLIPVRLREAPTHLYPESMRRLRPSEIRTGLA